MRYLLILLLTGCATTIPKVIEVKVPYAVSCVKEKPAKPDLITDAELLKLTEGNFVTALHVDRLKRINYESELESILIACEGVNHE